MVDKQTFVGAIPFAKSALDLAILFVPYAPLAVKVLSPCAELLFNSLVRSKYVTKNKLTFAQKADWNNAVKNALNEACTGTEKDLLPKDTQKKLKKYVTGLSYKDRASPDIIPKIKDLIKQPNKSDNDAIDVKMTQFAEKFLTIFEQKIENCKSLENILIKEKISNLQTQLHSIVTQLVNHDTRIDTLERQRANERNKGVTSYFLTAFPCGIALVGRTKIVKALCRKLCEKPKDSKRICLTGMGGIGKTAILHQVIKHFNSLKDKPKKPFDHIAFLTYTGSMTDSLMQINALGVQTVDTIWTAMQSLCLEKKKSVLLLIDDNRDNRQLHISKEQKDTTFKYLLNLDATVLFASRRPIFTEYFSEQRVDPLSVEDCITLFQNRCWGTKTTENPHPSLSPEDQKCLEDIIKKRAGRNTKAVERLGAITKHNYNGDVLQLSKELKTKGFAICEGLNDEPLQEEFNKLYCFEDVKDEREADKKKSLLEAFALFPADAPLNYETCIQWLCKDAQIDQDEGHSLLPLLNDLSESTWLTKQLDAKTGICVYSMHQVVKAAVITQQTNIPFDKHCNLVECLGKDISWSQNESFKKNQPYIDYADSLAEYFSEKQVNHKNLASLMIWLGRYYKDIADYVKALKLYEKALVVKEKVLGADHPDTGAIYNDIALVYDGQGDFVRALECFFKALAIQETTLDKYPTNTATIYSNIAKVYNRQGVYTEALKLCEKALDIHEKVLDKDPMSVAIVYSNIANAYYGQGDFVRALEWFFKALAIYENNLDKEHQNAAFTYHNIANVYLKQGDYAKALEWYNKALTICERVFGEDHPETATTYNNIAIVYDGQGDYVKVAEWYEKVLVNKEKILGKERLDTVDIYNNIAHFYYGQGNFVRALELYEWILAIRERVLGEDHPETATPHNRIANIYHNQGDYAKALEWCFKALAIQERVFGEDHPETATTYNNIAHAYYNQGDYAKALEWFFKALAIRERVLGKEHPDTAFTYNNIANVYRRQGDYAKALEWFFKDLAICERVLGKEHPDTVNISVCIASTYYGQGDYVKALEWYEKARDIYEKVFGKEH